jgi:hypothetical protein
MHGGMGGVRRMPRETLPARQLVRNARISHLDCETLAHLASRLLSPSPSPPPLGKAVRAHWWVSGHASPMMAYTLLSPRFGGAAQPRRGQEAGGTPRSRARHPYGRSLSRCWYPSQVRWGLSPWKRALPMIGRAATPIIGGRAPAAPHIWTAGMQAPGSRWNMDYLPDGNMRGFDRRGNARHDDHHTGNYWNSNGHRILPLRWSARPSAVGRDAAGGPCGTGLGSPGGRPAGAGGAGSGGPARGRVCRRNAMA